MAYKMHPKTETNVFNLTVEQSYKLPKNRLDSWFNALNDRNELRIKSEMTFPDKSNKIHPLQQPKVPEIASDYNSTATPISSDRGRLK